LNNIIDHTTCHKFTLSCIQAASVMITETYDNVNL
jgi:hypothetical protein